jgi:hypothetical protein
MAINTYMPSINNFLEGFSNGLPGMKDYQHASRLYIDDNFKLLPKQKFLFHVVFILDRDIIGERFPGLDLNMLVKTCSLPKYNFNVEEKYQYNKKVYIQNRISYEPVNITLHDDHADTVNAFWKAYYEYNIQDSLGGYATQGGQLTKDNYYDATQNKTQFGLDGGQKRKKPMIKAIEIFALHKKRFTSFTLINPVVASFSHDDLDQTDGGGIMANSMQIMYETVLYGAGLVNKNNVKGFATVHYDLEPSPLSVLGGGTTSIFGPGGIVDGIGSVISDIQTGNFGVGTILKGINTYNNAKKIKAKDAVKEELKGIVKEGVIDIAKQAGTITNPVGEFSVGNAAVAAIATGAALATAKGAVDNVDNKSRNTVIQNYVVDTQNFYSPSEAFNLISNNSVIQDQIASSIYYKTVGSRQGDTVAESDVEYASLTANQKNVYRARALTDITKLVTEGYIKIRRDSKDVVVAVERANL